MKLVGDYLLGFVFIAVVFYRCLVDVFAQKRFSWENVENGSCVVLVFHVSSRHYPLYVRYEADYPFTKGNFSAGGMYIITSFCCCNFPFSR